MRTYDGQEIQVLDSGWTNLLQLRPGYSVEHDMYLLVASLLSLKSHRGSPENVHVVHEVHYLHSTGKRIFKPNDVRREISLVAAAYAVVRQIDLGRDILAAIP